MNGVDLGAVDRCSPVAVGAADVLEQQLELRDSAQNGRGRRLRDAVRRLNLQAAICALSAPHISLFFRLISRLCDQCSSCNTSTSYFSRLRGACACGSNRCWQAAIDSLLDFVTRQALKQGTPDIRNLETTFMAGREVRGS